MTLPREFGFSLHRFGMPVSIGWLFRRNAHVGDAGENAEGQDNCEAPQSSFHIPFYGIRRAGFFDYSNIFLPLDAFVRPGILFV